MTKADTIFKKELDKHQALLSIYLIAIQAMLLRLLQRHFLELQEPI